MSLSPDQVRRIAQLARIEVSDADLPAAQRQLNGILSLVDAMQAVDTTGVTPMAHARDLTQRLRPDTVSEGDVSARMQALAPEAERGLYLVPKVIE
jgi:aspartyl-tRNA(Asn)/glutamyl-tRNA(Gln) amidotransferase subunit C